MRLLEWMLQATLLGGLFGAAALLMEPVLERRRWLWIATLIATAVVPLLALLAPSVWPEWTMWRDAPALLVTQLPAVIGAGTASSSAREFEMNPVLAAWGLLSLLCASRYVAGGVRLHRLSRRCVPIRVAGREVLLSERLGPAVIGLWRPRLVAPPWITKVGATRQRMIVLHEAEHLKAGDHWVLAAAPLVAMLLPWSVPVWWQVRRLRLAVELDCDARVLSHGVRPLEYGGLLLDVAASAVTPVAPALAGSRSVLERRIEAVAGREWRRRPAKCLALGSGAATAVVCGCVAVAPVRVAPSVPGSTATLEPRAQLAVSSADSVRGGSAAQERISIRAGMRARSGASNNVAAARSLRRPSREPVGVPVNVSGAKALTDDTAVRFDDGDASLTANAPSIATPPIRGPLIVVDGVIIADGTLADLRLAPDTIESIEVIKGPAAAERYGPHGADGVVTITTRRTGGGR